MDSPDNRHYPELDTGEGAAMDSRQRRGPRNPQRNPEREVVDRLRRIETRVTQIAIASGVRTDHERPVFHADVRTDTARITVPSQHTSLKEILDSVPPGWQGSAGVYIGNELLMDIALGNRAT
jgi:hypothetical protein